MKYKVRSGFFVYLNEQVYEPGTELELTDDQAALVAHQIEPAEAPKRQRKAAADDGAN